MAIVVESTSNSTGADSTSCVLPAPSGVAVGDLLIALLTVEKDVTVTAASGFSLIIAEEDNTNLVLHTYYKVATSSDAAASDFTFSLSATRVSLGGMLRISGQSTSSPIGASSSNNQNSITEGSIPSITPTTVDSLIVVGVSGLGVDNRSAYSRTEVASWTEHFDFGSTGVTPEVSIACATGISTGTSAGGVTYTTEFASPAAFSFVVNPEPVSVTVTPTILSLVSSLVAPVISTSVSFATTVTSFIASLNDPSVTATENPWTNQSKNTTTWTNQNKTL